MSNRFVIRLAARAVLAVFGIVTAASSVQAQQSLYVASYNSNTITKITGGVASTFASTGLSNPTGLAFDSVGNLYAANAGNNTIEKYSPDGVGTQFADTGLNRPYGLAFDGAGNLYAANYGFFIDVTDSIAKFTPDGTASVFLGGLGILGDPAGLAFDKVGNLYVANYLFSTIIKITPGGESSVFAFPYMGIGISQPIGLAFDSADNLYVANAGSNTIEKYSPDGVGTQFASTGLNSPAGLTFDNAGNLYAVNYGDGTIEEFNTMTGIGTQVASGLDSPTFLTFGPAAVPEASTTVSLGLLLTLGLTALTLTARKCSSRS